jgi:uncharacterized protein YukE
VPGEPGVVLRADVALDPAALHEATAACRTAAAVCAAVLDARARAVTHARVGWEGRMRDAFDHADDALRTELEAGAAALQALAAELESLGERAVTLQRAVDRHNDAVTRDRGMVPR